MSDAKSLRDLLEEKLSANLERQSTMTDEEKQKAFYAALEKLNENIRRHHPQTYIDVNKDWLTALFEFLNELVDREQQYKAAFFRLYEEQREIGDCGDCPVIDNGDGTCPALYADGSGSDESLCREQILNCYMESDNYVDNG